MQIKSFLTPERTRARVQATSKKRVLETIAELLANGKEELDSDRVFEELVNRERLGSTGLGNGVAIPHCRIPKLDAITGVCMSLDEGVDFESIDQRPVDMIFGIMVPEEANDSHLEALSVIAERFQRSDYIEKLRSAGSDEGLYHLLTA